MIPGGYRSMNAPPRQLDSGGSLYFIDYYIVGWQSRKTSRATRAPTL
jgi:hypothetical protein